MIREIDTAKKPVVADANLGFGVHFSPSMLLSRWANGSWSAVREEPRASLSLDPAAMVLHYGQAIFEGLKALHHPGGAVRIFRPESHARRFQRSAARLCMPELPVETFLEAVQRIVAADHEYVPRAPGCMYLRPTMIATEAALGVRAANEYLFFVIASPSGPYFKDSRKVLRIWVERQYVRAARGGLGSAKASANYAASLLATRTAKERGCDQVLWLDSECHREVEELGAGNVFFVWDGELVTPELGDSVLDGVTRDSLLTLTSDLGHPARVTHIDIEDVRAAIRGGRITEMFTCGTAAVVAPVGTLLFEDEELQVGDGKLGPTTRALRDQIVGILHGERADAHGWFLEAWSGSGN